MAARTGASIGVGVTITILSVLTLALFVLTLVFYGQSNKAERLLAETQEAADRFVRGNERERDDIRAIADLASRDNKSVVAYLADAQRETMRRLTGTPRDTPDQMAQKLGAIEGADSGSLLQVVRTRESALQSLERRLAESDASLATLREDLTNELDRVTRLEDRHNETVASLTAQIGIYKDEVDQYREGVQGAESDYESQIDRVRADAAEREANRREEIARLEDENQVLRNQLQALRGERSEEVFRGEDEFALVDGTVLSVNASEGQVTISRGRNDKIVLGMTFSIYTEASAIRPDDEGIYPPGKASIEVINVGAGSATCRILTELRGNPIVAGDVIANPVYDPTKVYSFVVFGNFDANRDSRATPGEASDIRAMIEGWGGQIASDLTGDVDFLVLGQPPILPPRPPVDSPVEVLQAYIRLDRALQQYNELFETAQSTSIPVLNENRLYTLLGRTTAPIRR